MDSRATLLETGLADPPPSLRRRREILAASVPEGAPPTTIREEFLSPPAPPSLSLALSLCTEVCFMESLWKLVIAIAAAR